MKYKDNAGNPVACPRCGCHDIKPRLSRDEFFCDCNCGWSITGPEIVAQRRQS